MLYVVRLVAIFAGGEEVDERLTVVYWTSAIVWRYEVVVHWGRDQICSPHFAVVVTMAGRLLFRDKMAHACTHSTSV